MRAQEVKKEQERMGINLKTWPQEYERIRAKSERSISA